MLNLRGSRHLFGIAALGASFGVEGAAHAHFTLTSPPAATEQSALGDPQKAPPCGDDGSAVATNVVSTYQSGSTITVTIDERIFHPGHYRIALAVDDIGELPEEPVVTPGATACGSAPIDPAPVFPVLADGVFEHTEPFDQPQSIEITLPDDVTCTHCTLQIIQFMSNHALNDPGGCYYHHCATLALESDPVGGTAADGTGDSSGDDMGPTTTTNATSGAGATGAGDTAGSGGGNTSPGTATVVDMDSGETPADGDGGCGCSQPSGDRRGGLGTLLGLLGLVGLRARRRAQAPAAK